MARSRSSEVPNESIAYTDSEKEPTNSPDVRLLHYNDVYHIEPGSQEPVGGAARFQTLCKYYSNDEAFRGQSNLVTLFSGDAFNPSLESSVTKGSHMIPILNGVGTNIACVGNHDLDFGVTQFSHLAAQCKFPWLLANVLDPGLGADVPLGHAEKTAIITTSNGIKLGIIGLVEKEWLDTINSLPPNLVFKSASATAEELVPGLRAQGAEMIIALTHQREPNDNKLAQETTPGLIDIVLGGHDHYYQHQIINETHVLRSGTDFKQLSYLEARRKPGQDQQHPKWSFRIIRRDVTSAIPVDPEMSSVVDSLTSALKSKLEKPVGYTAAPLDARFMTVRLKESNLGNFVCDIMRMYYSADACIMAAGTIRGDQIYPPGVLKLKDVMNCFPFEDPVVVINVKGKELLGALENSVSKYPALEGRFPQVSNIELEFDPEGPEGSRIIDVKVGGEALDPNRKYKLATRGYMARGKDGYDSLLIESEGGTAEEVVSEENGVLISMLLRQYFMSLKVLGRWRRWGANIGRHWGGVHEALHQTHPVREPKVPGKDSEEDAQNTSGKSHNSPSGKNAETMPSLVGKAQRSDQMPVRKKARTEATSNGVDVHDLSDSEDDSTDIKPVPTEVSQREHELVIMRKVTRKWWRLAGLKGHPNLCDEQDDASGVHWTKVGKTVPVDDTYAG
ncbi:MAG: hypothetical protein M1820_010021 [Bogoriella megaspora]|nr:MAG: hypothetical protein M1820_010021 [Bogoriella megaspora]